MTYAKLLDIIRSPELIKFVTKNMDEHFIKNGDKHIKEQVWVVKRDLFVEEQEKIKKKEKEEEKMKKLQGSSYGDLND